MALKAGAKHVTAVERWLYLSLAANQVQLLALPDISHSSCAP